MTGLISMLYSSACNLKELLLIVTLQQLLIVGVAGI